MFIFRTISQPRTLSSYTLAAGRSLFTNYACGFSQSEKERYFEWIIFTIILHQEKFLQFDWLRAVVFQLSLQYLHVKITNLLRVVVNFMQSTWFVCKWEPRIGEHWNRFTTFPLCLTTTLEEQLVQSTLIVFYVYEVFKTVNMNKPPTTKQCKT